MPRRAGQTTGRLFLAAAVLCSGLGIAWMDTRPAWDDTGITAGAIFLAAAAGTLGGVGVWLSLSLVVLPILGVELSGGTGVLLTVPVATLGAFAGALARKIVSRRGAS